MGRRWFYCAHTGKITLSKRFLVVIRIIAWSETKTEFRS